MITHHFINALVRLTSLFKNVIVTDVFPFFFIYFAQTYHEKTNAFECIFQIAGGRTPSLLALMYFFTK
jgi:hypothetical protein